MVFSRKTFLKALNYGLIFTSDIALNIQRECKGLTIMEPVCAYAANIAAIGLPHPMPAANVTEAIPVTMDASQALSAGGEAVFADGSSEQQSWWQIATENLGFLTFLVPLLAPLLDFLPAWLRPANNDNNRQEEANRLAEVLLRELAPLRAQLAEHERTIAALRAEQNRAPDGDKVEGVPEEPAKEVLPGEASSIAEPKGDNSIHTVSDGESEVFDVANSRLGPDDKPEQAEGSTAAAGSEDGGPKRRTHRSKAGRANRHLRRAREREEEARRAEAEREASFAALFREEGGEQEGEEKGKKAVGTPHVRLPGAA